MSYMTRREALAVLGATGQGVVREPPARKRYVVLASGADEYQSDRTLAELAQELESRHGLRCSLLAAGGKTDLAGLEALEDAAVAVLFVGSLELPADQLNQVRAYLRAGKPLVALRSSIRAFENWKEFGPEVLGASWRYDYGEQSSTDVKAVAEATGHPLLEGVAREFHCRSWLFHVLPLAGPVKPLLMGTPAGPSDRAERVPNPVAWTRTYKGGRIFYTSLGHPEDFTVAPFRRLLVNAVNWALAK